MSYPQDDNSTFSISLTESQRAQAVRMSGTPGGDIGNVILDVLAGTVVDLAGNPNLLFFHVVIIEHDDKVIPTIISAQIDLGNGHLLLFASETMDATPRVTAVNHSLITLVGRNDYYDDYILHPGGAKDDDPLPLDGLSVDPNINLVGAQLIECNDNPIDCDGIVLTIVLTEKQRARAVNRSSTPGGDGINMTLSILDDSMRDIALNTVNETHNISIVELADHVPPTTTSARLNYSDGVLVITASETIDVTPSTNIDPSKLFILDDGVVASTSLRVVPLTNAKVTQRDGVSFTVTLTEAQRVAALEISMMPGGITAQGKMTEDPVLLETSIGAYFDVGTNDVLITTGIVVSESADVVPPTLVSAAIDLNDGKLRVLFSETIDTTPAASKIDTSRIFVRNDTAGADELALSSSGVVEFDSLTVTLKLTETERVKCIERSATSGGDGAPISLRLRSAAVHDIGTNVNRASAIEGVVVAETADVTPPEILSAELNYGTGVLVVTCSETIDSTPATLVRPELLVLVNDSEYRKIPETDEIPANISLAGATITASDDPVGKTFTVHITESMRVAALYASAMPLEHHGDAFDAIDLIAEPGSVQDIAQNRQVKVAFVTATEVADTVRPFIKSALIDFNDGTLELKPSETLHSDADSGLAGGKLDLTKIYISNQTGAQVAQIDTNDYDSRERMRFTLEGALSVEILPGTPGNIRIVLNEAQRIAAIRISNTTGPGDKTPILIETDSNAITDLSLNRNIQRRNILCVETPDTTPPSLSTLAKIDYSTGTLTVRFSETVSGSTGVTGVNPALIYMSNSPGTLDFSVAAAYIPKIDLVQFSIVLSEPERALAIAMSGTPGGDKTALYVETLQDAFSDISLNRNPIGIAVLLQELPDIITPGVVNASFDFGTGQLIIFTDEFVDSTPNTLVDFSKIFISNSVNSRDISLSVPSMSEFRIGPNPLASGTNGESLRIDAVSVVSHDADTITLALTEAQRAAAVSISHVAGTNGDDQGTVLDVLVGAVVDIAQNRNDRAFGVSIREIPDTVRPFVLNASLDLGSGVIKVYCSEKMDTTPFENQGVQTVLNVSALALWDTSTFIDETTTVVAELSSPPGITLTQHDSSVVELTLSEPLRVLAVKKASFVYTNSLNGNNPFSGGTPARAGWRWREAVPETP